MLVVTCVVVLLGTPVLGNMCSVVTGNGFEIPQESSVWTFRVTEMNRGSCEWWMYAEDDRYFYAQGEIDGIRYIALPQSQVGQCASFQARDWTTWCRELAVLHEST